MKSKLEFILSRFGERLWVKPLLVCMVSIGIAFAAQLMDELTVIQNAPDIKQDSLESLLEVISSSMLVIAVFAVGAMLAAYQSASNSATPRAFSLVVADDTSQNALSTFIGAFIFSIVAQVALLNGYYGSAGRFVLFVITCLVFVLVILNFLKWVDGIARLGRVGTTIFQVERATDSALQRQKLKPFLGGVKANAQCDGQPVYHTVIGYLQRIDMQSLQTLATKHSLHIELTVRPGKFITPEQPVAYLRHADKELIEDIRESTTQALFVGNQRTFDNDPRFGLITLSEIASRALSPAVNDPGTAIQITGIFVRLFVRFAGSHSQPDDDSVDFPDISVPPVAVESLFEDAFHAMSRDGASCIEVVVRVQKALATLASTGDAEMATAAKNHSDLIVTYAEKALQIPQEQVRLDKTKQPVQDSL